MNRYNFANSISSGISSIANLTSLSKVGSSMQKQAKEAKESEAIKLEQQKAGLAYDLTSDIAFTHHADKTDPTTLDTLEKETKDTVNEKFGDYAKTYGDRAGEIFKQKEFNAYTTLVNEDRMKFKEIKSNNMPTESQIIQGGEYSNVSNNVR